MTSPIGYGTLRVTDSLWPHLSRLNPTCMLFIDDAGAATRFANEHPSSVSIYRAFRGDESTMYLHNGEMLKYVKGVAAGVDAKVYINVLCEPALGGDYVANLKQLVKECIACLDWAYANGRRLALPHGAWYGLNPEHFPILVPLINKINERPAQAVLTSDEYFGGMAFSGVHDALGGEAWHVDPSHWLASPDDTYYHMGRITVLFKWLKTQGITPPRWIATETGADDLSDIGAWLKTLKVNAGYSNIRGWKTLVDQWFSWYGSRGWSGQRAYVEMLSAAWREIYAPWPNVIGLCLFTWGVQEDQTWAQFDLSAANEFQRWLEQVKWKGTAVPVPIPARPKPAASALGTPLIGNLVTPTFVNLRIAPSTSAAVALQVAKGVSVAAYPVTPAVSADGYDWRWAEPAGHGGGWMALLVSSWSGQIVPTIPVPPPADFLPAQVSIGAENVDQYLNVDGPNACGPAMLATLVRFVAKETGATQFADVDANDTSKAMKRGYGKFTGIADYKDPATGIVSPGIVSTAKTVYGLTLDAKVGVTLDQIKAELDAGRIIGILYLRGAVPGELAIYNYGGAHFGCVTEWGYMTDGSLWFGVMEPLQKGLDAIPIRVRAADLDRALQDEGSGNTADQAMFIDPLSLSPVVPPPEPETSLFSPAEWREIDARILAKIQEHIGAGQ